MQMVLKTYHSSKIQLVNQLGEIHKKAKGELGKLNKSVLVIMKCRPNHSSIIIIQLVNQLREIHEKAKNKSRFPIL